MSLNYDLSKIANAETVCWEPIKGDPETAMMRRTVREDGKAMTWRTQTLIFVSMALGLGEITEKTAPTWWARLRAYERLFGPMLRVMTEDGPKGQPFTAQDIRDHIGLKVNVSREADAAWAKRILASAARDAMTEYYNS